MAEIECIYRARIDYDIDSEDSEKDLDFYEKVENQADSLASVYDCNVDCWGAGPAWNAYILIECPSHVDIVAMTQKLETYIKRFKNAKVL